MIMAFGSKDPLHLVSAPAPEHLFGPEEGDRRRILLKEVDTVIRVCPEKFAPNGVRAQQRNGRMAISKFAQAYCLPFPVSKIIKKSNKRSREGKALYTGFLKFKDLGITVKVKEKDSKQEVWSLLWVFLHREYCRKIIV